MAGIYECEYDGVIIDVAIDFDGTCVTHKYPGMGSDIGAQPVLKQLIENGHRLILCTMRDCQELVDAIEWFSKNDIPLYGVQVHPDQLSWTSSPKTYRHIYIGDDALGCPVKSDLTYSNRCFVDWNKVENLLIDRGYI